jgi:hypothetical protein
LELLMLRVIILWSTGALAQEGPRAPLLAQDIPVDPVASAHLFGVAQELTIPHL